MLGRKLTKVNRNAINSRKRKGQLNGLNAASQLSRGRTRQDHPGHAGKCQQQLVRESPLLKKRVGQRLKARRCFHRSQASHLSSGSGANQSGN
ncbi:MAG: hypothetical protein DMG98_27995 [Acidobacteria bacterium]|nr:MAG: hypothetical protein DMG98_27995 [Acidobacteriota bacterium]